LLHYCVETPKTWLDLDRLTFQEALSCQVNTVYKMQKFCHFHLYHQDHFDRPTEPTRTYQFRNREPILTDPHLVAHITCQLSNCRTRSLQTQKKRGTKVTQFPRLRHLAFSSSREKRRTQNPESNLQSRSVHLHLRSAGEEGVEGAAPSPHCRRTSDEMKTAVAALLFLLTGEYSP
jgi:hypothetical protein